MSLYKYVHFADVQGKKMKPTKAHRLAMWECMLGTVYARDEQGAVAYFDYNYTAAAKHAGIEHAQDIRIFKVDASSNPCISEGPSMGQLGVFIK